MDDTFFVAGFVFKTALQGCLYQVKKMTRARAHTPGPHMSLPCVARSTRASWVACSFLKGGRLKSQPKTMRASHVLVQKLHRSSKNTKNVKKLCGLCNFASGTKL